MIWDVERVGMLAYHFGPTWAATVYKRGRRVFGRSRGTTRVSVGRGDVSAHEGPVDLRWRKWTCRNRHCPWWTGRIAVPVQAWVLLAGVRPGRAVSVAVADAIDGDGRL